MTDVLGVVTSCNDLQNIVSRGTGKEFVKRDINIIDESGMMVSNLSTSYIYTTYTYYYK